jgi:hypothetical protein
MPGIKMHQIVDHDIKMSAIAHNGNIDHPRLLIAGLRAPAGLAKISPYSLKRLKNAFSLNGYRF